MAETNRLKEAASHPFATIALLVMIVVDFAMLVIGLLERNECPLDSNIPLYLIVAGGVGLGSKVIHIFNKKWEFCLINVFIYVVYVVEIVWMILGSYWVYKVYIPNYDPQVGPYCDKTAYLLSFWFITIHYILLVLSFFLSCCCCFCPNCIAWFNWRKS